MKTTIKYNPEIAYTIKYPPYFFIFQVFPDCAHQRESFIYINRLCFLSCLISLDCIKFFNPLFYSVLHIFQNVKIVQ